MNIYYKYNIYHDDYDELNESKSFDILKYDKIVYLDCCYNNLINLPILPINLINFDCSYNKLINLPILPKYLKYLSCSNNKLNYLPKINKLYLIFYDKNIIKYINSFNKIYNLNTIKIKIYYYIKF